MVLASVETKSFSINFVKKENVTLAVSYKLTLKKLDDGSGVARYVVSCTDDEDPNGLSVNATFLAYYSEIDPALSDEDLHREIGTDLYPHARSIIAAAMGACLIQPIMIPSVLIQKQ